MRNSGIRWGGSGVEVIGGGGGEMDGSIGSRC